MADIELVIKIPEEIYNSACALNNIWDMRMAGFVCAAIANGIPHETVTEFADRCRECGREKVLDKIRTEIEQTAKDYDKFADYRRVYGLWIALEIIDKYKTESEDRE